MKATHNQITQPAILADDQREDLEKRRDHILRQQLRLKIELRNVEYWLEEMERKTLLDKIGQIFVANGAQMIDLSHLTEGTEGDDN